MSQIAVVIGAGPAGIFTAQALAQQGIEVILLNRDIKPGGLAEYGIYRDKHQVKEGLRYQFHMILNLPNVTYLGNVAVGEAGTLTLAELQQMGFGAVVVAIGAQAVKWLGLPGEHLAGVYHAKEIIYHYNDLPPFSQQVYAIGRRVALVGVGNVMADVAHWLIRDQHIDEVVAVARRGPAEVKFTRQELAYIAGNLDLPALQAEFERVQDRMSAVGQSAQEAHDFILSALPKALPPVSGSKFRFRFLSTPHRLLGDDAGRVTGLEVEDTDLAMGDDGETRARGLGTLQILDVDTVIFCIGDRVSNRFGLPVQGNSFARHPHPGYPVDGDSFEAYDPENQSAIPGIFIVGWAREASKGQVGAARRDAQHCAQAVSRYLADQAGSIDVAAVKQALLDRLAQGPDPVVTEADYEHLLAGEAGEAIQRGLPYYHYASNEEMLQVIRKNRP